jgi:hypothetical protein
LFTRATQAELARRHAALPTEAKFPRSVLAMVIAITATSGRFHLESEDLLCHRSLRAPDGAAPRAARTGLG